MTDGSGHIIVPTDLSRPPLEDLQPQNMLGVRREDLPEVHFEGAPHCHLQAVDGDEYALAVIEGDTPRQLALIGLHYIALGVALNERLGIGHDEPWTGQQP